MALLHRTEAIPHNKAIPVKNHNYSDLFDNQCFRLELFWHTQKKSVPRIGTSQNLPRTEHWLAVITWVYDLINHFETQTPVSILKPKSSGFHFYLFVNQTSAFSMQKRSWNWSKPTGPSPAAETTNKGHSRSWNYWLRSMKVRFFFYNLIKVSSV